MRDTSFRDYIVEDVLGELEGIAAKGMFGGWGVYHNGIIFGLILGDELYFKVDDTNRALYEALDSHPFTYEKQGKTFTLSYWSVPEQVMEDKERLYDLVDLSVAVSKNKKK